jgi:hypothetical protein
MSNSVPSEYLKPIGKSVLLQCVNGGTNAVPLYEIDMSSTMTSRQPIVVAVVPNSFRLPENSSLLMGNDCFPPMQHAEIVSAVTTRRMARKDAPPVTAVEDAEVSSAGRDDAHESSVSDDADLGLRQLFEPHGLAPHGTINRTKFIELQKACSSLAPAFEEANKPRDTNSEIVSHYFVSDDGMLLRKYSERDDDEIIQIVVPACLRGKILNLAHSIPASSHMGITKTRKRILQYFFWSGIDKDIAVYCKSCDICQRVDKRGKLNRAPLMPLPIIDKPFSRLSVDVVGPLPQTVKGNRFILTVIDHSTRWVEAYALTDHKASTIAQSVMDFVSRFGTPKEILHDLGADFTSELFQVFLNYFGISQLKCSVAHPQTNTCAERWHATLKRMLRSYVAQCDDQWDDALCYLLFAFRGVEIAEYGYSPYEMVFGQQVHGPLQLVYDTWWESDAQQVSPNVIEYMSLIRERMQHALDTVHANQAIAQQKGKTWYDKKARMEVYEPGDNVLVLSTQPGNPLRAKYQGPYQVVKKVTPVDYQIEFPGTRKPLRTIHVNLLKRYIHRVDYVGEVRAIVQEVSDLIAADDSESDEYAVSSLLDSSTQSDSHKLIAGKVAHLPAAQAVELGDLIQNFGQVISDKPGLAWQFTHTIKLKPGAQPVRINPYRMSSQNQERLRDEIHLFI